MSHAAFKCIENSILMYKIYIWHLIANAALKTIIFKSQMLTQYNYICYRLNQTYNTDNSKSPTCDLFLEVSYKSPIFFFFFFHMT